MCLEPNNDYSLNVNIMSLLLSVIQPKWEITAKKKSRILNLKWHRLSTWCQSITIVKMLIYCDSLYYQLFNQNG